jgi:hypothetical protein
LLAVAVQVEVLVAARPGIQRDFEHALFLETEVEGTQTLEVAKQLPREKERPPVCSGRRLFSNPQSNPQSAMSCTTYA